MKSNLLFLVLATAVCLTAGCASYLEIAEDRRQRLLKIYPLHLTTRNEVANRWAPTKPEFSYERPPTGWLALETEYVGKKVDAVEKTWRGMWRAWNVITGSTDCSPCAGAGSITMQTKNWSTWNGSMSATEEGCTVITAD